MYENDAEFIRTLRREVEAADIAYSMDYEDDARLVRLERKVDAIIEYLLKHTEVS